MIGEWISRVFLATFQDFQESVQEASEMFLSIAETSGLLFFKHLKDFLSTTKLIGSAKY